MAGPLVANAQAVTYDFTGIIDAAEGSFDSIPGASAVNGSFTINFDAVTQVSGDPGAPPFSQPFWTRGAEGGSQLNGTAPPAGLVFSASMSVNGSTYAFGPISPLLTASSVTGDLNSLVGVEAMQSISGPYSDFRLTLEPPNPNTLQVTPYLSNGLPNLANIDLTTGLSSGLFGSGETPSLAANNEFNFYLTSLIAVSAVPPGVPLSTVPPPPPLPPAVWLFSTGLGAMGFCLRRRSNKVLMGAPTSLPTLSK